MVKGKITIEPIEAGWVATQESEPTAYGYGSTPQEALRELEDALEFIEIVKESLSKYENVLKALS